MAALNLKQDDDWTPAKLAQHQAWRAKMYAPEKLAPKPEPVLMLEPPVDEPESAPPPSRNTFEDAQRAYCGEMDIAKFLRAYRQTSASDSTPKIREIIAAVSNYYDCPLRHLLSSRRSMPLVRWRQISMFLCRQFTGRSLPEVGRHHGDKDHTTVINAVQRISELRLTDAALCQEVAELEALFA